VREDDFIARVRRDARIRSAHPDYTDAIIREEAWGLLAGTFAESVQRAHQGYWRQSVQTMVAASQRSYRLPHRALANTADVIEYLNGAGNWTPVNLLSALRDRGPMTSATATYPTHAVADSDRIELYPLPSSALTVRTSYMLRPPKLVQYQTAGEVTAVDADALTVEVNTVPDDQDTGSAVTTSDKLDIIHPNGGHELALVGVAPDSIVSTTLTFPSGTDLSKVEVGDFVRAADQTDWPMLHEEFHATLAAAEAASICLGLGKSVKAQQLAAKVSSDLARMRNMQEPRLKDVFRHLKRRNGLGRHRGRFGRRWPVAPGGS
jgi:hypothetical protein